MSTLLADGSIAVPYENFIALSRYARFRDDLGRRETWGESVDRYVAFMIGHLHKKCGYIPSQSLVEEIRDAIKNREIMPSMRALMTAGQALEECNIAGYNCAYLPIDDLAAFSETLYILLCGTGVGFSVEHNYVDKLPRIAEIFHRPDIVIQVGDSKLGWAQAYKQLVKMLWIDGIWPSYDLSAIRPKGARLRTFGGRASGPEPLKELFDYTISLLWVNQGNKLRPIQVHDLMCKIASVVVVGGVRRSAMISLSDIYDREMAEAKSGTWWEIAPHRALANNSAVFYDTTTREEFDREWATLVGSGSGERGIFNRDAARRKAHTTDSRREVDVEYGVNPCGEVILRPYQFCNLSEVVVYSHDDADSIKRKVELATILGTWQSTLTDFPFLRPIWKENTEKDRLLGVSLTGVFGNSLLSKNGPERDELLTSLNQHAKAVNIAEAARVGVEPSAARCTQKPSGTVSQLAGVSSGGHPWHAQYYIRTVRADRKDPLARLMADYGVPNEPDVVNPDDTLVFSFPVAAPEGAITRADLTAVEHLEHWYAFRERWCDHNPSVTVNVRPEEWDEVGEWVWAHRDSVTGVSFLPYEEHTYRQAPYQEITREEYEKAVAAFPDVRWADLPFYEMEDMTSGGQTLACSADGCDSADLVST